MLPDCNILTASVQTGTIRKKMKMLFNIYQTSLQQQEAREYQRASCRDACVSTEEDKSIWAVKCFAEK